MLDLVGMPKGESNVVKPIEQAVLAKRLYLESEFFTIWFDNALAQKIDRQPIARKGCGFIE